MRITLKVYGGLLDRIRVDLARPHAFAHERIGFLTAGACMAGDELMLLVGGYIPVSDGDYEPVHGVGAQIGSNAMRKVVQAAYRPQRTILHVHTHGGHGIPSFSAIDLESANTFVPGFFQTLAKMPHGLLVLSDDAATGILWRDRSTNPVPIDRFVRVGACLSRQWSNDDALA